MDCVALRYSFEDLYKSLAWTSTIHFGASPFSMLRISIPLIRFVLHVLVLALFRFTSFHLNALTSFFLKETINEQLIRTSDPLILLHVAVDCQILLWFHQTKQCHQTSLENKNNNKTSDIMGRLPDQLFITPFGAQFCGNSKHKSNNQVSSTKPSMYEATSYSPPFELHWFPHCKHSLRNCLAILFARRKSEQILHTRRLLSTSAPFHS